METHRAAAARPGDEIDLVQYAATSWRYRWVILAAVLLVVGVTYLVNRQLTPVYEVTVRMLATESQVNDDAIVRGLNVKRFRELLESPSLVASVLADFNLSAPPHNLGPRRFLDRNLTVSEVTDTGILLARIRLTDPDTLVKLANDYADKAVALAAQLNTDETSYARGTIKGQLDEARNRLTQAEINLEEFRKKTQIELLRKDVDAMLEHRPEVLSLQVDIESERAQLQQAEIELAQQERVRDARRSIDNLPDAPVAQRAPKPVDPNVRTGTNPAWDQPFTPGVQAAVPPPSGTGPTISGDMPSPRGTAGPQRGRGAPGIPDVPEPSRERISPPAAERPSARQSPPPSTGLQLRSELNDPYVNPVYEVLARDVAQSRARLSGLERRRQQLSSALKLSAPTNAKLDALYRAETQLARLTSEYHVARTAYTNAASKFEEARLAITLRSPRLQVLDKAFAPEEPVAPKIARNVVAAAMLALMISIAATLLYDSSRRRG